MATVSRQLISEVMDTAQRELRKSGMRKRKGGIYTCQLNQETLGWVGLNRAVGRGDGLLEINPVIGVRHQPLERILADIRGEKFHDYIPPSIGVHLGYLMPQKEYTPWLFAEDRDNAAFVKNMVAAIMEYGQPFMETNSILDALCETMHHSGFGVPDQLAYRLPVAYFILSKITLAEAFLTDQLVALGNRTDLAAQCYRKFATKLVQSLKC
ncbi:MAG: hypothetical protein O7E52_17575 [Candidatus Poribacteria bacterium]|nr:hypothetical protein [Candidatus Poribacteria bacterium]